MTPMTFDVTVFLTIGLAAMVTYLLPFGGLMLSGRLPKSGRCRRFMDALPGAILLSLIAPGIVSAGWWGAVGAMATALCAYKTGNTFVSMLLGVGVVALQRHLY